MQPSQWTTPAMRSSTRPAVASTLIGTPADAVGAPLVIEVEGDLISKPYVEITLALMARFGVEVARENLPEGDLTDATLALASIGSADETSYFDVVLDPAWVVEGTNTLAVEVHQSAPDSSDLGFDLAVTGQVEVTP
jgi:hypothetical protein